MIKRDHEKEKSGTDYVKENLAEHDEKKGVK